jgi:uncharacterized protein YdcH (DUF465 family)
MKLDEETIKRILMEQDEEFNKLIQEHQECEKKLQLFDEKKYLTEEEKIKKTEIKKIKLGIKDKIYQKIRDYQHSINNQNI